MVIVTTVVNVFKFTCGSPVRWQLIAGTSEQYWVTSSLAYFVINVKPPVLFGRDLHPLQAISNQSTTFEGSPPR